ncbi:hypothetical protein, partial [Legionella qingyii]|uniref:hypothetical protein n=1 Tax=Legionella qingyii TaxID=2184757 RepID=UPI000FA28E5D
MPGQFRERYKALIDNATEGDLEKLKRIATAQNDSVWNNNKRNHIRQELEALAQEKIIDGSFAKDYELNLGSFYNRYYGDLSRINDNEADWLQTYAGTKRASLKNARTIKTGITALSADTPVLNGNNVVAALDTYELSVRNNAGNGVHQVAARRAALQTLNTSLNLGFPDVSAPANLSNEEYAVIEADVLAKRISLTNAAAIKTGITALSANTPVLNGNNVVAALDTYELSVRNNAGHGAHQVAARRAALQTLNTSLNLGFPDLSAPANLSNEEYAV